MEDKRITLRLTSKAQDALVVLREHWGSGSQSEAVNRAIIEQGATVAQEADMSDIFVNTQQRLERLTLENPKQALAAAVAIVSTVADLIPEPEPRNALDLVRRWAQGEVVSVVEFNEANADCDTAWKAFDALRWEPGASNFDAAMSATEAVGSLVRATLELLGVSEDGQRTPVALKAAQAALDSATTPQPTYAWLVGSVLQKAATAADLRRQMAAARIVKEAREAHQHSTPEDRRAAVIRALEEAGVGKPRIGSLVPHYQRFAMVF